MLIAILGIIILIVGIVMKRSPEPAGHYGNLVRSVGIVVVLLGLALSAFKVIAPGKVGVQTLFGQVQDQVLPSGLHIINPLVDVTLFNIQTQNYTMSAMGLRLLSTFPSFIKLPLRGHLTFTRT